MDSTETTLNAEISTADADIEQPEIEYEIEGNKVTHDELIKGYLRQSDYTRKTQELARQREALEKSKSPAPENDDEAAVDNFLQSKEYVKKDFVEKQLADLKREQQLDKFFEANPELANQEMAIRKLALQEGKAPEDIVVEYKFTTSDKVQKAKGNRMIIGNSEREQPKEKSIGDMTSAEFEAFRKKNLKKGGSFSK